MPQADLKYSSDLDIDADEILRAIEETILNHDDGAGACKGRAYPASQFRHTHMLVQIAMLAKPHRNAAFTAKLIEDLEHAIKARINQRCLFSLDLGYTNNNYVTNEHIPAE